MKKILLALIVITSIVSCSTQEVKTTHNYPSSASGYTLDSTANTDLVKSSAIALAKNDTAGYRKTYSSDVVFHDNNDSANLTQNLSLIHISEPTRPY